MKVNADIHLNKYDNVKFKADERQLLGDRYHVLHIVGDANVSIFLSPEQKKQLAKVLNDDGQAVQS